MDGQVELPHEAAFAAARERIDDVLRAGVDAIGPYHLDEDDEPTEPVDRPLLADWLVLTSWMDAAGDYHYVRIGSAGLSPHARLGLLATFDEAD